MAVKFSLALDYKLCHKVEVNGLLHSQLHNDAAVYNNGHVMYI